MMEKLTIKEQHVREVLCWYFNRYPTKDAYGEETAINKCVDHFSASNPAQGPSKV